MHRPKGVNRTAQGFSPGNSYPKKNRPERTAEFRALFPTIRTPFQGDIVVGAVPRAEALGYSLFALRAIGTDQPGGKLINSAADQYG
jgi:hypothetical protein